MLWRQADGMHSVRALLVSAGVDMTGWSLLDATGVSASGNTVVGYGSNPDAFFEAWIARFAAEGIAGLTTPGALQDSANKLADRRFGLLAQQHGFAAPLLGDDKPIGDSNEIGIYASAGSAAGGGFVRYSTGMGVALLAGLSYAQEDYPDTDLEHAGMGALALQYLDVRKGAWRPFAELGAWGIPDAALEFERTYANGAGTSTGVGNTHGDLGYVYARAGVLVVDDRLDQVAVSGEIGRQWMTVDGYSETISAQNPFAASIGEGTEQADLAKLRLMWSHQFSRVVDGTVWLTGVQAFNRSSGLEATVAGVGLFGVNDVDTVNWAEFGARVGYKLTETVTLDGFANGVSGEEEIGTHVHAGLGLRYQY